MVDEMSTNNVAIKISSTDEVRALLLLVISEKMTQS